MTSDLSAHAGADPREVQTERPPPRVNFYFRLAAGLVMVFVITIFALIATMLGDPAAPVAKLLDRIGMLLIVGEMCAILIVGTLAMTIDRRTGTPPASEQPAENMDSDVSPRG